MASKPLVAVYDACVLYPFHVRNILIQCAVDGLVLARWTDEIHEEWIRNLVANSATLSITRLLATRDKMKAVLPDATVADYEALISGLSLPDPDDRHVLAAAIASDAKAIVTWNLKDFPAPQLESHGIVCLSPDTFLVNLYAAYPKALISSIARARRNLRKTMPTVEEFTDVVEQQGLKALASILRRHTAALL